MNTRFQKALWPKIAGAFGADPEATARGDRLIVSWLTKDDPSRPNKRSREIIIDLDGAVSREIEAADDAEIERCAVNAAARVTHAMRAYDPGVSEGFAIQLHSEVQDR